MERPAGFVCVSFVCNNRIGNQIKSYKKKKKRKRSEKQWETKVRLMGTAANCIFENIRRCFKVKRVYTSRVQSQ